MPATKSVKKTVPKRRVTAKRKAAPRRTQASESTVVSTIDISPWDRARGKPRPNDYKAMLGHYEGWLHHCIGINASSISETPLRLYALRRGPISVPTRTVTRRQKAFIRTNPVLLRKGVNAAEFDEVDEHLALTILDKPNPYMRGREFLQLLEIYLGLTGNAYVFKGRGLLGQVESLWPMPAQYVTIVPGESRIVDGYIYSTNGTNKAAFGVNEIIHLRRPNPRDPYFYGLGEAESEADMVWLSGSIDDYEIGTFRNNARPDGILEQTSPDAPPLTTDQVTELRREFYRLYSGPSKAGRIAVLRGGVTLRPLGWSPKDISYFKGEDKVMLRIANACGIPKSMLTTDDVNLANARAGERQYARRALVPRLRYIEEALTEDWVSEYDDRLFLAFDDPVPVDEELQLKKDIEYVKNRIRPVNEIRLEHGWEPIEGQDELRAEPTPPSFQPNPNPPTEPPKAQRHSQAKHYWHGKTPELETERQRKFADALEALFANQAADLEAFTKADMTPGDLATELEQRLAILQGKWHPQTVSTIRPYAEEAVIDGGVEGAARLAAYDMDFDPAAWTIQNPAVSEFVNTYTIRLATQITDTTQGRLKAALRSGLDAGESIPEIRDRIRGAVGNWMGKRRAAVIARTEEARAVSAGSIEVWKQAGVTRKVWKISDDACEYCQSLDGETVEIEGNWRDLGGTLQSAANPERVMNLDYIALDKPPAHPLCRCRVDPVIEGF